MEEDSVVGLFVFMYLFVIAPLLIAFSPDCQTAVFVAYCSILFLSLVIFSS